MRQALLANLASAAIAVGFVQPLCASTIDEGSATEPSLLLEDRDKAAAARIAVGDAALAEFQEIARDPVAVAQAAASAGDFRLIQFHVHSLRVLDDEATFAGVDCSVPWATGMTRAIWDVFFSDVISLKPPEPSKSDVKFDEKVARAYNAALLARPDFPYADLCASTDDAVANARKAEVRPPDNVIGLDRSKPKRWWWRWSERRLPNGLQGPSVSIAIRNGDAPSHIESTRVDDVDEFGMTALGWAAARAPRSVVVRLLDKGADPWFGNYCALRTRWHRYGPVGGNLLTTPVVIAIVHRRFDIAADMLAKAPRKRCDGGGKPEVALREDGTIVRAVDIYARAYGAEALRRVMVGDYFDQLAALDSPDKQKAWNVMAEFALSHGLQDVLRSRPDGELHSSRTFAGHMAGWANLAELQYWIDRLDLRSPTAIRDMLGWVRPLGQTDNDRHDYQAKVTLLAGLAARFDAAQKQEMLRSIFGSGLGPKGADLEALRIFVTALRSAGFDLNSADYGGSAREGGPNHCTLLMLALSYSGSDECYPSFSNDKLATVLLEQGADPNIGRTSAGLTAFDIVRRRSENGPNSEGFAAVRERMEQRADAAGTTD